jgi:serine phosphatase RsbU (regulator of sigma subunit)
MVLAMTIRSAIRWLLSPSTRYTHMQRVPMRQLWVLMVAVVLLFSVIGFYTDVMSGGVVPYAIVIAIALVSGINAMLWIIVLARLPMIFLVALIAVQFVLGRVNAWVADWMVRIFHPVLVQPEAGLHFAGTGILILVVSSYFFMTRYMGITGKETIRIQNELELAQSIQKTLVPPIARNTPFFEVFGISHPSDKVGGDLVDVVELRGGDTVAYLADIAGHGLQAGILMGMLKTASRTALTSGSSTDEDGDGGTILSTLMQRLNLVLPQVKEAHMYATFTALRLNADGQAFYGMAASPPLLHWSAAQKSMLRIEEEQFPLGLLPVADFPSSRLTMAAGDIVLIATDGILEVTSELRAKRGVEFGVETLEALVAEHADRPLPELAATILTTVRQYGRQLDDQTLLLVRRSAA